MLQALNILFWWTATGVALFYFRRLSLAVENASLTVCGFAGDACDDGPAAHAAYDRGCSKPIPPAPLYPTAEWAAEQQKLLEEMARTKDNRELARNAVDEELG